MPKGFKKLMKVKRKIIFLAFIIFSPLIFFPQSNSEGDSNDYSASIADSAIPSLLEGIWENSNRYVIFDSSSLDSSLLSESTSSSSQASQNQNEEKSNIIPSIALRNFYRWYVDRAAEDSLYSKSKVRPSNDSTSKKAQELQIHFEPLTYELFTSENNVPVTFSNGTTIEANGQVSGAWDMQVKYPNDKNIYHIPIAVIGNKLYLHFKIRHFDENAQSYSQSMNGFWQDYGSANGILVCPPVQSSELLSYYVTDSFCYPVRYWQTDMEYDSAAQAFLEDEGKNYSLPKHIFCASKVYTCVLGRRTKIRNITKTEKIPEEYVTNSVTVKKQNLSSQETFTTSTICAIGEPYLTLLDGSQSLEEIIAEAEKKVRPAKKPLFPVSGGPIDFDFSIKEDPPSSYNRRLLDLGK